MHWVPVTFAQTFFVTQARALDRAMAQRRARQTARTADIMQKVLSGQWNAEEEQASLARLAEDHAALLLEEEPERARGGCVVARGLRATQRRRKMLANNSKGLPTNCPCKTATGKTA